MAKTIDEAYEIYLSWLTPTELETKAAVSHRASIKATLESHFGMTHFFRSGSFGFGTSVTGYSDVDYFAVIPAENLKRNSASSLAAIRTRLKQRFPKTRVWVDSPAVVLEFCTSDGERHEIIPAHLIRTASNGVRVFGIPNRATGWMQASPEAQQAYVNAQHKRLGGKLKPLIRLIKSWKYHCGVPIRSIYLEMVTTMYASGENAIVYEIDVQKIMECLYRLKLSPISDPTGTGDPLNACARSDRSKVFGQIKRALHALLLAKRLADAGQTRRAFSALDEVFGGEFPAYH